MNLVVPIVEGHGELDAVPVLLRRIGSEIAGKHLEVNPPFRVRVRSFLQFGKEFEKVVKLSAAKAKQGDGLVLILLDCEDDCPATLGPQILAKAEKARSDVQYVVCLAYREFETWFLYAASSLAGKDGLPVDLLPPALPESHRDAKGWLGRQMNSGYKETEHQVSFSATFDLERAQDSASFKRLVHHLCEVL